ncbi:hypothetical protein MTR67_048413 [Solanum verrucosum]|uniref:Uncharacterized protein n=1 Tax=Solanum verrucosum TaxID=315347 RepID=A0AAF0UXX1_SOLVR|nr:hypothetical protein MTR67_048413 [Solanum verrucosum]
MSSRRVTKHFHDVVPYHPKL